MNVQPTPQLNPEQSIGGGSESIPQPIVPELNSNAAQNNVGQPAQPTPPQLTAADVTATMAAVPTPGAPTPGIPTPTVAADQDVIEPEWVDKAEKVVAETAGNPFAEEEGIENLQIEYLKQRYGREVKKPENS